MVSLTRPSPNKFLREACIFGDRMLMEVLERFADMTQQTGDW